MSTEKFDVIVVGGGVAGSAAAYRLAQNGAKVLLIERGSYPGAKNMTGGRLYTHSLEVLIPDFRTKAPLERKVVKERISIMNQGQATTVEYHNQPADTDAESYVVLRSKFDRWLAGEAEKAGALLINRIQVTELIKEGYDIVGVRCGQDEMRADVVILADGVNSLLAERAGLRAPIQASEMAIGAKEVYSLSKQTIEDRFNVNPKEGAAWLFLGDMTHDLLGGGFLYTNDTSLSVGVVVGMAHIGESDATIEEMMEEFTRSPIIAPLIKGGKLIERSGHVVPEAGIKAVSTLSGNGFVIIGDAAGLCINMGYTVRGMDFAIASGMYAADAILACREVGDFSAAALKKYDTLLMDSFVGRDLKLYRNFPDFLTNKRIFTKYPAMVNGIMEDVFTVNGRGATPLLPKLMRRANEVGVVNLAMDAMKGVRSL